MNLLLDHNRDLGGKGMSEWRKLVHLQALKNYFVLNPGNEDHFLREVKGILNALEILPAFEENGKIYRSKNEKLQFWLNPDIDKTKAPFKVHFWKPVPVSSFEALEQEIIKYFVTGSWKSSFDTAYSGCQDSVGFLKAISFAEVGTHKLYNKILELLRLEFSFRNENYKYRFGENRTISEIKFKYISKSIVRDPFLFRPETLHILANVLKRPILLFADSSSQHVVPELIAIRDWNRPLFLSEQEGQFQVLHMKEVLSHPHLRFIAPQFTYGEKVFSLPQLYEYFNSSHIYRKFDIGPINPKDNF